MKLEDQVCSIEYAKKLKELGVKQESLFYYVNIPRKDKAYDDCWTLLHSADEILDSCFIPENPDKAAAFTVAELFEMLPEGYSLNKASDLFYCEKRSHGGGFASAKNPADTVAKMLIYLLENEFMEPPK
jgi:hypothetical protein